MKLLLHALYHAIFWSWNFVFLLVVGAGILPHVGVPLARAIWAGEVEPVFLLPLFGLVAIPVACTWLGWQRFRRRPLELMRLFYGVEAPAFTLCLVRLFLLRDLTPGSTLVVVTVLLAIAAFGLELLAGYRGREPQRSQAEGDRRSPLPAYLQTSATTMMLLVGAWASALLLIYATPAAKFVLDAFFSFHWLRGLWWAITNDPGSTVNSFVLFSLFFALSSTLFLAMPSAFGALYLHSGQRIWRAFARDRGRRRLTQVTLGTLTAWLVLFIALNQQPQVAAFARLEGNSADSFQARHALLAETESLRAGLTNAYLASYRYLGSRHEGEVIAQLYRNAFALPDPLANTMQVLHDTLLSPFLYQGSFSDENKAAKLYADFFDQPIQKGEQDAVLRALQSTAILDDANAGTLNIDQRKVLLAEQQVTVTEQGDWAEVELYEVYHNQTFDEEEIFYAFSLPETAVVTGVWLGDTGDRDRRFPFQVSPRGAAQQVYNEQVNRVRPIDPALLEQVGPRHYRLRAFPIPPQRRSWEIEPLARPTEMHLWLTYKVMRQSEGWPLPQLGERRNIFWTEATQRRRNGESVAGWGDRWLEASLPASSAPPRPHTATVAGYRVTAQPLDPKTATVALPASNLAIILDTSYSMAAQRQAVQQSLAWLQAQGWTDGDATNGEADLYVAQADGLPPQRFNNPESFDWSHQPTYGSLSLTELLTQFTTLRDDARYDAVLILTDAGSYELAEDEAEVPALAEPLWLVHLGGEFPAGYQDEILERMQDTQGGVATSLPTVFERLAVAATQQAQLAGTPVELANVADGYIWTLTPLANDSEAAAIEAVATDEFVPLAARQLVQGLSRAAADTLAQLDTIHAIAKSTAIVTPYSSMVVLVNDEQRRALAAAEAAADRFAREVEAGQEQLVKPFSPLQAGGAASVPEPGMVLGMGAIALFLVSRRRQ
ncbi:MAG: TIGR02921 family PEP-CTERM protein [Spirulinaceae cyanobacterium SM2_1_0]|nr:TIGR02921 family PEP-CTERM protein [Spirulinaceae cyanobacterium SM2_1_0]